MKKSFYTQSNINTPVAPPSALTLAEVLITLAIIGVVSALTIPTLVKNYQEKQLIVKTKKVWADINNAILMSQNDYGVVGNNSLLFNKTNESGMIADILAKYFKGSKVCKGHWFSGCSQYYYTVKFATERLNEDNTIQTGNLSANKIILQNGAIISISTNLSGCAPTEHTAPLVDKVTGETIKDENGNPIMHTYTSYTCANLQFDVNGANPPNQYGRDVYYFWVYRNKLEPCFDKYLGGESFQNILSGKDKLEYFNYTK